MQLPQRVGFVEDHLGHVRAGLDVAAALQLEDVALGADHRAVGQPLEKGPLRGSAHDNSPSGTTDVAAAKRAGENWPMS